jgi:dihydroorotase-like cyclic amidohydrolase
MIAGPVDLVIKNVRLVRPKQPEVAQMDVGIKDGRYVRVEGDIPAREARQVFQRVRPVHPELHAPRRQ